MTNKKGTIKKSKKVTKTYFPANLLAPVGNFLQDRLKYLEKRKNEVETSDPFKNSDRASDNASPDADAEEQFGHARTSAIKSTLDRKIIQTKKALAKIKLGNYGVCEDCGEMIDTERLMIYPEATMCAKDAAKRER
jgi:DnaK suppressor protein